MMTDDDRREVARRLRELADDYWLGGDQVMDDDEAMDRLFRATGFDYRDCENWSVLENGEKDLTPAYLRRLADLIEPSCDRDALLALAEEMVEMFRLGAFTGEGLDAKWCRELHGKYARHIREALGVSDG